MRPHPEDLGLALPAETIERPKSWCEFKSNPGRCGRMIRRAWQRHSWEGARTGQTTISRAVWSWASAQSPHNGPRLGRLFTESGRDCERSRRSCQTASELEFRLTWASGASEGSANGRILWPGTYGHSRPPIPRDGAFARATACAGQFFESRSRRPLGRALR